MKPNTQNPGDGDSIDDELPSTTIFAVLSSDHRQHTVQYLVTRPGGVELTDIAEYVMIADGPRTRECYERILTELVHIHLPRLVDDGFVTYDADRELVSLLIDPGMVAPYLELTSARSCK